ncbi:MAG: AAC(3) family N-acetyltransferase [Bdellovibrionales bacterium]|nr:AAC(3) family N-acetyltransferase [Bdellovibrionales bacterium]
MRIYTQEELLEAFKGAGIDKGDTVLLTTRLYGVGKLEGADTREQFCEAIYAVVREALGPKGTLVVPTFSQQVGSHGVNYVHEETPCRTGIFAEYVLRRPDSIRSFHPVFSLTAEGSQASRICENVSSTGFGHDSAMERLHRYGAKAVCIGFEYYTGHIVAGMHSIETLYGVPYYYNKIVTADVYRDGKKCNKDFVINVRYLDFNIAFDYRRFIDLMARRSHIRQAPVGDSCVYSCTFADMFADGFDLLNDDVYAFLKERPNWKRGVIPFEGSQQTITEEEAKRINWKLF